MIRDDQLTQITRAHFYHSLNLFLGKEKEEAKGTRCPDQVQRQKLREILINPGEIASFPGPELDVSVTENGSQMVILTEFLLQLSVSESH